MKKNSGKSRKFHLNIKAILIFIIIVLLLIIFLTLLYFCLLLKNRNDIVDKNTQAIVSDEQVIEYGTSLSYDEIIDRLIQKDKFYDNTSIKLFMSDDLMTNYYTYLFNVVGNVLIRIETSTNLLPFFERQANINYQVIWKVQDTKMPILSGVQDIEITEGDKLDIKSNMSAFDEVDGRLEVIIEGDYDRNKAGEYPLTAKAMDKNKNITTQDFKLIVKSKS